MLKLVNQGLLEIVGPIRQEISSGIGTRWKFDVVRDRLRAFLILNRDWRITRRPPRNTIVVGQGDPGIIYDFRHCSVAIRHELEVLTDDKDFLGYKTVLPIRLYHFGIGA